MNFLPLKTLLLDIDLLMITEKWKIYLCLHLNSKPTIEILFPAIEFSSLISILPVLLIKEHLFSWENSFNLVLMTVSKILFKLFLNTDRNEKKVIDKILVDLNPFRKDAKWGQFYKFVPAIEICLVDRKARYASYRGGTKLTLMQVL